MDKIDEVELRKALKRAILKNKILIVLISLIGLIAIAVITLNYHFNFKTLISLNIILMLLLMLLFVDKIESIFRLSKMRNVLDEYCNEIEGEEKRKKFLLLSLFTSIYYDKFKKFFK